MNKRLVCSFGCHLQLLFFLAFEQFLVGIMLLLLLQVLPLLRDQLGRQLANLALDTLAAVSLSSSRGNSREYRFSGRIEVGLTSICELRETGDCKMIPESCETRRKICSSCWSSCLIESQRVVS